jgi:hypothetical protein
MIRAGVDPAKLPFQIYATDILIEGVGWIELVCQVRKNRRPPAPAPVENQPSLDESTLNDTVPKAEYLSIESAGFVPFITSGEVSEPQPSNFPVVEIFTPSGKFVGQRPCLDMWQLWNTGKPRNQIRSARPRKPMSGRKKSEKMLLRRHDSFYQERFSSPSV